MSSSSALSGSLPMRTYHRASHLGDGTFGSVVTVYDADGHVYALKRFLLENEDEECAAAALDLGLLREVSVLRLFRCLNRHEHIIELQDVQTDWNDENEDEGGAGTAGCFGMALPLGRHGSLADAIANQRFGRATPKYQKVSIAYGLLDAVSFLHNHGIIHRDIKSDNILLEYTESTNLWKPILIDFSLAKPIHAALWGYYDDDDECEDDCSFYYNLEHLVHTGEVGTVAYTAPEILAQDDDEPSYYGKPADVYSVGIVLLELIRNHIFTAHKVNAAKIQIQQAVQELPSDTPFANLVRSMIQTDPSLRPTAQQAMSHELFPKFGFIQDPSTNHPIVRIATALPHGDDDEAEEEEEENEPPNESVVPHCKQRVEHVKIHKEEEKRKTKRLQLIDKILHALGTEHPWTRSAAYEYSIRFQEIDDADEMNQVLEPRRNNKGNKTTTTTTTQSLLDCCILAHKFWELELLDYPQLPHDQPTLFADWSYETYIDNEATIFMLMDYCLYPRTLLLPSKGTK